MALLGLTLMIVALLVFIVLILLFGAGVVRGWLANVVGLGCGGLVILMALLWLGSFFGENGVTYIMYAIGAVLLALAVAKVVIGSESATVSRTFEQASPTPRQTPLLSTESRDKVWQRWAADIALNFDAKARAHAQQLYDQNDDAGLDRFCREKMKRLRK